MTDIDVSKIKPGDLVKIDVRWTVPDPWLSIKGWHKVTENDLGQLCAAGQMLRWRDGSAASDYICVRRHKPVPQPIPTEPGTRFRATVRGVPDQVVMRVDGAGLATYVTVDEVNGLRWHGPRYIADVHDVVLP